MTRFERAASGAASITGGSGNSTMGQNESIFDASDERTYGFNYRELEKKGYSRKEIAKDPWAASPLIDPGDRERERREREAAERKKEEERRKKQEEEREKNRKIEQEREKAASLYWKSSSSKEIPYKKF